MNLSKAWNAKLEVGIFWRGVIELRQNIEKTPKSRGLFKNLVSLAERPVYGNHRGFPSTNPHSHPHGRQQR